MDYVPAKLWKELAGYVALALVALGVAAGAYFGSTGLDASITTVIALFGLVSGLGSVALAAGTAREIRAYRLRQLKRRYGWHPASSTFTPRPPADSLLDPRD